MAHGGEEGRFRLVGHFGLLARLGVPRNFQLELLGTLVDEALQFLAMAAQLFIGALALGFERPAFLRFVAEGDHCGRKRLEFLCAFFGHRNREVAVGQTLHGAGQRRQSPHDAALDIEPDDQAGNRDGGKRRKEKDIEAGIERILSLRRNRAGEILGAAQHSLRHLTDFGGQVLIGLGYVFELVGNGDQPQALTEQAHADGAALGRLEHPKESTGLVAAHRVVDTGDAPADDTQMFFIAFGDFDDFVAIGRPRQLMGEQSDLRTAQTQLPHPAEQIDVLLDETVERFISGFAARSVVDQAIEARHDGRGTGRRVRHEGFRQIDDRRGRLYGAFGALGETPLQLQPLLDQPALRREIGHQRIDGAREFRNRGPVKRCEAGFAHGFADIQRKRSENLFLGGPRGFVPHRGKRRRRCNEPGAGLGSALCCSHRRQRLDVHARLGRRDFTQDQPAGNAGRER